MGFSGEGFCAAINDQSFAGCLWGTSGSLAQA